MKSLEGVELHQQADENATTRGELLSALRFRNSRNKIDSSPPPPYIVLCVKLLGDWPSIVNEGCRFALQARVKFLDQVRILSKSNITWNHGRILLCPGFDATSYATFGIPVDSFQETIWSEPTSSRRGLKRPASIQEECWISALLRFNSLQFQSSVL